MQMMIWLNMESVLTCLHQEHPDEVHGQLGIRTQVLQKLTVKVGEIRRLVCWSSGCLETYWLIF